MRTTISVPGELRDKLTALSLELSLREGRRVALHEVLQHLLDRHEETTKWKP